MYQLTQNAQCIIRLDDGAFIPAVEGNADYQTYLDWVAAGNNPLPIPTVTVDQVVQRFLPQLQSWLDGIAQQNGYDSALSCISYLGSSVAQWNTDAQAMRAYRDALWVWAYQQQVTLNGMTQAQLDALSVEQIIAQAPQAADYGWVIHGAPS